MSINIPTHFVQQYSTNLQLLLQQKGSKLRHAAMSGSHVGKQASPVDQLGAVVANKVTSRFSPKARVDASTDRRWVYPTDYDLPQLIDSFDRLRLITDPNSAYVLNGVFALGRAMDDELLTAVHGTSKTGESGATSTTLPASQTIDVGFGASADVGLTVKKLLEAKRILMAAEVDLENDMLFCAIRAKQHDDLLNEIQVISRDYNSSPVLVNGKVQSFLGINFIPIERLKNVSGETTEYRIPLWVKSGLHLGIWNDIQTSVTIRNDLQGNPWEAYAQGTFGATRLEEKKIIDIECQE